MLHDAALIKYLEIKCATSCFVEREIFNLSLLIPAGLSRLLKPRARVKWYSIMLSAFPVAFEGLVLVDNRLLLSFTGRPYAGS